MRNDVTPINHTRLSTAVVDRMPEVAKIAFGGSVVAEDGVELVLSSSMEPVEGKVNTVPSALERACEQTTHLGYAWRNLFRRPFLLRTRRTVKTAAVSIARVICLHRNCQSPKLPEDFERALIPEFGQRIHFQAQVLAWFSLATYSRKCPGN
jgi:hypothetical protein